MGERRRISTDHRGLMVIPLLIAGAILVFAGMSWWVVGGEIFWVVVFAALMVGLFTWAGFTTRTVDMDDRGLYLHRGSRVEEVSWSDVVEVQSNSDPRRLVSVLYRNPSGKVRGISFKLLYDRDYAEKTRWFQRLPHPVVEEMRERAEL